MIGRFFNKTPLVDVLRALENDIQDSSCKWKVEAYQHGDDIRSLSDEDLNTGILCTVRTQNEVPLEYYLDILESSMPVDFVIKDHAITVYKHVNY